MRKGIVRRKNGGEREGRERSWTNPQLRPKPPSLLLIFHNEGQLQHQGPDDDTDDDDAVLYLVAGRLSPYNAGGWANAFCLRRPFPGNQARPPALSGSPASAHPVQIDPLATLCLDRFSAMAYQ